LIIDLENTRVGSAAPTGENNTAKVIVKSKNNYLLAITYYLLPNILMVVNG
jgi:hypothetical protein